MRKLIAAWQEIIHDFGWPVLAVFFAHSVVSIVVNVNNPDIHFTPGIIAKLVALVAWLTIIAALVPRSRIAIPVRRPLPELAFLAVWGATQFAASIVLWDLVSSDSPYVHTAHYLIVFGRLSLAVLFAIVFQYSAKDLGIGLKQWRLYLIVIILAFPIGKHFLRGDYFHIFNGIVSLGTVLALYRSGPNRWSGIPRDLKSLRPFVLPILLCAFVTVAMQWARYRHITVTLPLRVFDTYTMPQGAIPEEFYYRLGLQTRLTCFAPFGWAALLQGIAFGVAHIPQNLARGTFLGAAVPWTLTGGMVNALAAGYFWQRSKNLPAVILFHMAVFI